MATKLSRESPPRKAQGDVFGASRGLTEVPHPARGVSARASTPTARAGVALATEGLIHLAQYRYA